MVTRAAERGELGSKKIQTGVAISATELCAVDIRLRGASDRVWRAPLDAPPSDGASWPSLASALAGLANALGVTSGTLAISLVPPLTEVRQLELPPLRDDDLQRLLLRNSSRYFVGARGAQIVGASPAGKRQRGTPTPIIAAAASARMMAMIHLAAEQTGWVVDAVAPAETAWAAAAVALWPAAAKQNLYAVIAHDDRTDLLQIEGGRLVGLRRFRAGAADAGMIADALGPSARVGVTGSVQPRRQLAQALGALGLTTSSPSGEWANAAEHGDVLAAHFAGSNVGPVLRSEDHVAAERARARKTTMITAAAAAALVAASALIEIWGVHHQLDLVRQQRAQLRPALSSTLIGRTTVEATYRHLETLNAIERSTPQWAAVITTLSKTIPGDAYLTAIRSRGDSLIVDGLAEHAARVFDSLEKAPGLTDVKAAAAVRRELQDDGTALDHFTIAARVVTNPPARATTSPASNSASRRPGQ
jgi:Tfp pilus assembly protein PilN